MFGRGRAGGAGTDLLILSGIAEILLANILAWGGGEGRRFGGARGGGAGYSGQYLDWILGALIQFSAAFVIGHRGARYGNIAVYLLIFASWLSPLGTLVTGVDGRLRNVLGFAGMLAFTAAWVLIALSWFM